MAIEGKDIDKLDPAGPVMLNDRVVLARSGSKVLLRGLVSDLKTAIAGEDGGTNGGFAGLLTGPDFIGSNFVSYYTGKFNSPSFEAHADELRDYGANAVAVVWQGFVVNDLIDLTQGTTEQEAAIRTQVASLKGRGFKVMLKPHLDAQINGQWVRGNWVPANDTIFWASYRTWHLSIADVAQDLGCEIICMATEMTYLTGPPFTARWLSLIADVRAVYDGKLTIGANFGSESIRTGPNIENTVFVEDALWLALDYVGTDLYAGLTTFEQPTREQLIAAFDTFTTDSFADRYYPPAIFRWLEGLCTRVGKPLIICEIGFRPLYGGNMGYNGPNAYWQEPYGADPSKWDPAGQAACYEALFTALSYPQNAFIAGVFLWGLGPELNQEMTSNGVTGYNATLFVIEYPESVTLPVLEEFWPRFRDGAGIREALLAPQAAAIAALTARVAALEAAS